MTTTTAAVQMAMNNYRIRSHQTASNYMGPCLTMSANERL